MLKRNIFSLVIACVIFLACNNRAKNVAVWDSYLDYDSIIEECADTFTKDNSYIDSQVFEYANKLEELQEIVPPSNHFEFPAYTS